MHLFQFGPTRDIRTENRVSQEQRQSAVRQKQTGQLEEEEEEEEEEQEYSTILSS